MAKRKFLPETHPHLLEQWDWENNGDLLPSDVSKGQHLKVNWLCSNKKCKHKWKAVVHNRTKKINPRGCPACSNRVVTHKNNLAVKHKKISDEWDTDKNFLGAEEVTPGSHKKVYWLCSVCKYSWKAYIYSRTKDNPTGCPACTNMVVTDKNNLAVMFLEISKDWDIDKNIGFLPETVTSGSGELVWWLCDVCSFSWKTSIYHRTKNKSGCPKCSKGNISRMSQRWLDKLNVLKEYREYTIKCKSGSYRVDGFCPRKKIVYEFLGDYWHGNPNNKRYPQDGINKHNKKSFGKLYKETFHRLRLLEKAGYKVVYIWESDFLNL